MSPTTRIAVESFWEYVAFALNSIVFLLVGLEVHIDSLVAAWKAILSEKDDARLLTARVAHKGLEVF